MNHKVIEAFSKYSFLLLLLFGFSTKNINAQISPKEDYKPLTVSVFVHYSYAFEESFLTNKSAKFGLGLDLDKKFNSKFSLLIRTVWRPWEYDPLNIFHICFAPKYTFDISNKLSLSPYIGIGPSLIIGNDYAGFFASSMAGLKLTYKASESKSIFVGTAYNEGSSFHPGSFEFGEIFIGIEF